MDDKASDTYIADITPDMFVLQKKNKDNFEKIYPLEDIVEEAPKKKGLFSRIKKKRNKKKSSGRSKKKEGKKNNEEREAVKV